MTTAAAILIVGRPLEGQGVPARILAARFGLVPPQDPAAAARGAADRGKSGLAPLGAMFGKMRRRSPARPEMQPDETLPPGFGGYHLLQGGHAFFGVEVRCVWDQWSALPVASLNLSAGPGHEEQARLICAAIPAAIEGSGLLMPFGTYLVGTAG